VGCLRALNAPTVLLRTTLKAWHATTARCALVAEGKVLEAAASQNFVRCGCAATALFCATLHFATCAWLVELGALWRHACAGGRAGRSACELLVILVTRRMVRAGLLAERNVGVTGRGRGEGISCTRARALTVSALRYWASALSAPLLSAPHHLPALLPSLLSVAGA